MAGDSETLRLVGGVQQPDCVLGSLRGVVPEGGSVAGLGSVGRRAGGSRLGRTVLDFRELESDCV